MQDVLKAVKTLGEYCNNMNCQNCVFSSENFHHEPVCLFRQTSPWSIGAKIKVEVKEILTWEGK